MSERASSKVKVGLKGALFIAAVAANAALFSAPARAQQQGNVGTCWVYVGTHDCICYTPVQMPWCGSGAGGLNCADIFPKECASPM